MCAVKIHDGDSAGRKGVAVIIDDWIIPIQCYADEKLATRLIENDVGDDEGLSIKKP